jgi:hypothetical protein
LHDTFHLGPPVRRHAEAIDDADDAVSDLVHAVACAQAPIDPDRMKRLAVSRSKAAFAGELAGDDCRSGRLLIALRPPPPSAYSNSLSP